MLRSRMHQRRPAGLTPPRSAKSASLWRVEIRDSMRIWRCWSARPRGLACAAGSWSIASAHWQPDQVRDRKLSKNEYREDDRMSIAVRENDVSGLLSPRSVAVIGASEDLTKFGGRIFKLLVQHRYDGAIYPINPKRESLLGIKAYPSIDATPTPPDMAVMAVPRDSVKAAVAACAAAGTKAT